MNLFQSSLAIIGILCAVIWLGCGDDDDDNNNNEDLVALPPSPQTQTPTTKIAFTSDREGDAEIFVMGNDGTNVINLTKHPAYDEDPAWSPDGAKIAFVSDREGNNEIFINSEIFVMDNDGTNVLNLTKNLLGAVFNPDWSPNGKRIVFEIAHEVNKDGSENWEIYVMNADGTNVINLTKHPAYDEDPAWVAGWGKDCLCIVS